MKNNLPLKCLQNYVVLLQFVNSIHKAQHKFMQDTEIISPT